MNPPRIRAKYWYKDQRGRSIYCPPDNRSVCVQKISDTLLVESYEKCNQTRKMWQHIGQNVADNPLQAVTRADLGFTKADSALTKNEYLCKNFTLGRWIFLPSASIVPLSYC